MTTQDEDRDVMRCYDRIMSRAFELGMSIRREDVAGVIEHLESLEGACRIMRNKVTGVEVADRAKVLVTIVDEAGAVLETAWLWGPERVAIKKVVPVYSDEERRRVSTNMAMAIRDKVMDEQSVHGSFEEVGVRHE